MISWIKDNRKDVIIAAILFAVYLLVGLLGGEWGVDRGNMAPLV